MAERSDTSARRDWMGLLATAPGDRLTGLWSAVPEPAHDLLRAPEQGTVMVRGRTGATGAPFNLGEMAVTRCAVRLADGTVGHGYVQGRDKGAARAAALVDALMQTGQSVVVQEAVLTPLRAEREAARADRAAKSAATRVEFFTLVRGED